MSRPKLLLLAFFGVLSVHSSFAQGGIVNYGDFVGDNVDFINVTETTLQATPPGLYNPISVSGNDLVSGTQGFILQVQNGDVNFFDSRLTFTVEAHPGFTFDSITIEEFGAFFVFGPDSIASVAAVAFVQTADGSFSNSFQLDQFGSNLPVSSPWSQTMTINFPSTNFASFQLDNSLFGFADDPGVAFVDKKGLVVTVNAVPEPSSVLLLGLTLVGCTRFRTSRKSLAPSV